MKSRFQDMTDEALNQEIVHCHALMQEFEIIGILIPAIQNALKGKTKKDLEFLQAILPYLQMDLNGLYRVAKIDIGTLEAIQNSLQERKGTDPSLISRFKGQVQAALDVYQNIDSWFDQLEYLGPIVQSVLPREIKLAKIDTPAMKEWASGVKRILSKHMAAAAKPTKPSEPKVSMLDASAMPYHVTVADMRIVRDKQRTENIYFNDMGEEDFFLSGEEAGSKIDHVRQVNQDFVKREYLCAGKAHLGLPVVKWDSSAPELKEDELISQLKRILRIDDNTAKHIIAGHSQVPTYTVKQMLDGSLAEDAKDTYMFQLPAMTQAQKDNPGTGPMRHNLYVKNGQVYLESDFDWLEIESVDPHTLEKSTFGKLGAAKVISVLKEKDGKWGFEFVSVSTEEPMIAAAFKGAKIDLTAIVNQVLVGESRTREKLKATAERDPSQVEYIGKFAKVVADEKTAREEIRDFFDGVTPTASGSVGQGVKDEKRGVTAAPEKDEVRFVTSEIKTDKKSVVKAATIQKPRRFDFYFDEVKKLKNVKRKSTSLFDRPRISSPGKEILVWADAQVKNYLEMQEPGAVIEPPHIRQGNMPKDVVEALMLRFAQHKIDCTSDAGIKIKPEQVGYADRIVQGLDVPELTLPPKIEP